MKTLLSTTALIAVFSAATAQITYTSDHLPMSVWVLEAQFGSAEAGEEIITPPANEAQVWDFTEVLESPNYDAQIFESPEGLPGSEHFPNATSAYQPEVEDTAIYSQVSYYQKTDSGFYQHGIYSTVNDEEQNIYSTSIAEYTGYLELPANFTYGWSSTVTFRTENIDVHSGPFEQFAYRTVSHQDISFECDAWGTMHTPVYPDGVEVLRLKLEVGNQIADSLFQDTTHTGLGEWMLMSVDTFTFNNVIPIYRFLQCDSLNPTVAFAYEIQGTTNLGYFGTPSTTVTENDLRDLSVFPNPVTSGTVNIQLDQQQDARLVVTTTSGKVLFEKDIRGESMYQLKTQNWPSGIIILRVYDRNGALRATGKLVNAR